ncbi:Bromodomain-containing protein, partial [Ramicandelaber brevisporus]
MSRNQLRHCLNVVRRLKKHNCAAPFLEPVDIVAFNIPNYPDIIKHPMDLGTLERNLTSKRYKTVESFSRDARLIFNNCYTFNGPDSPISLMAKELEIAFTSDMKNIPPPDDLNEVNSNEKQPSGYNSSTQKNRPTNASGGGDAQLKFCAALIREVTKNQYQEFAYPFYEPVDWKALNIPDYPLAVKHPMDIGTIRKKLERGKYTDASQFEADFRLMLNNCFIYNPPGNAVHEMGRKLE